MKKIYIALMCSLLLACEPGDFGNMNLDPNTSSTPNTGGLLTAALLDLRNTVNQPRVTEMYYVQYFSSTQYTNASNYETKNFDFNTWYTGPLMNLQVIIDLLNDEEEKGAQIGNGGIDNQIAAATIAKAYFFQFITDRWGDVPYTEALLGVENISPKYDDQGDIYRSLIASLKEAEAMIDQAEPGPTGDIIFKGNMAKWDKFSKSLRLNMALRMSDADGTTAATEFAAAASDINALIIDNGDNVYFEHLPNQDWQNDLYAQVIARTDYAISERMVDYLLDVDDPRLSSFANEAIVSGDYVGMPYGLTEGDASNVPNSTVSLPGDMYTQQTSPSYIMVASQIYFCLAEGAKRGFVSGGPAQAEAYYNKAIELSMQQWGVYDAGDFALYIAQPEVAYNDANAFQLIGEQKWLALFLMPIEAWSEYRRLDFPVLTPGPASTEVTVPVRQGYPNSERDINTVNYNSAVDKQGPDDLNTRVWWDIN